MNNINYEILLEKFKHTPRVNGYISPNTETKLSPIHGLGLFALNDLKKDEIVAAWGGHMITKQEVESLPENLRYNYALEIYPGLYLAEINDNELDRADFINHSCQPNCKIVNNLVMITNKDIKKGEELTCNFSEEFNIGTKTKCNCGSKNCTGIMYY